MWKVANALKLAPWIDFQAVEVGFGDSIEPCFGVQVFAAFLPQSKVKTEDDNWNFILLQNITQGDTALWTSYFHLSAWDSLFNMICCS